jgi:hypothetical protein
MKIIQLKTFIETGMFDTISIGSTKDELIEKLGNKYNLIDSGETQVISYGWYEFFYWTETGKILGIQNDHLVADCINHNEMINFSCEEWQLDNWFLKNSENITFKEVEELLTKESISYEVQPTYEGCDENIIRCFDSNVKFDFSNEFKIARSGNKDQSVQWENIKVESEDKFVLNGIRLFE